MVTNTQSKDNNSALSRRVKRKRVKSFLATNSKKHMDALFRIIEGVEEKTSILELAKMARKLCRLGGIGFGKELRVFGWRILICSNCHTMLYPGMTGQVRVRSGNPPHLVVTCLQCNHQARILLEKEQSSAIS